MAGRFNARCAALLVTILLVVSCTGSDDPEKWVRYKQSDDGVVVIKEYSSFAECSEEQQALEGCRRIDGNYNIINSVADNVFGK